MSGRQVPGTPLYQAQALDKSRAAVGGDRNMPSGLQLVYRGTRQSGLGLWSQGWLARQLQNCGPSDTEEPVCQGLSGSAGLPRWQPTSSLHGAVQCLLADDLSCSHGGQR